MAMLAVTQQADDVLLPVKVVPQSSRDRIAGELAGVLKVTVSAAPEKGAANQAVCRLIAVSLGIHARQVTVEQGHGSPRKTLRIIGVTRDKVQKALTEAAATGRSAET